MRATATSRSSRATRALPVVEAVGAEPGLAELCADAVDGVGREVTLRGQAPEPGMGAGERARGVGVGDQSGVVESEDVVRDRFGPRDRWRRSAVEGDGLSMASVRRGNAVHPAPDMVKDRLNRPDHSASALRFRFARPAPPAAPAWPPRPRGSAETDEIDAEAARARPAGAHAAIGEGRRRPEGERAVAGRATEAPRWWRARPR